MSKHKISKVVLTGGPCGGKTTAMAFLKRKFEDKGYRVIVVPEAATLCINGGLSPVNPSIGPEIGQRAILSAICGLEAAWDEAANKLSEKSPVLQLCDRGIPDIDAYVPRRMYKKILAEKGLNLVQVRDERYHVVLHLVTAALGAEGDYTTSNNGARYEKDPRQAFLMDHKLVGAWMGAPHWRAIDNSTDFNGKIRRVYQEICRALGIPVPVERERKYLVTLNPRKLPKDAQRISIEQIYTPSPDITMVRRLRRRGQHGYFTFYETLKQSTLVPGENLEIERFISEEEYRAGSRSMFTYTGPIIKTRTCFAYNFQYFELDKFEDKRAVGDGKYLLELEITDRRRRVDLPPYIKVEREVTGDPNFSNFNIARRVVSTT